MTILDHAVIWHVYPLGATGAPIRDWQGTEGAQAHRLPRLINWLDYAVELGCDTLLLAPIFSSDSHGYDTLDYFRIDPRLGDEEDFLALADACRDRGINLLLDGVFNHVSINHPMVADNGPIKRDDAGQPVGWEGHGDLVELDHSDPRTVDLVAEVMEYWLARGIAGWRLDVAYAVPVAFWAAVTDRVRQNYPNVLFLGEIIHGDYLGLINDGHLDTVTQYELWKAIWSSIKEVNFWELAHAIGRHDEFIAGGHMQTFVGNHDVDRIASVVGDAGAAVAATILLTLPGVPSIYYGDEQAFRGAKAEGFATDDPLRPALPEYPNQLAEQGGWMHDLHRELIGMRRRHGWLTRARVEALEKTNETLHYAVTENEHRLDVRISLAPEVSVELTFDDGESLRHSW
ncbi:alpha-amylase family glycosyl hydrolase [Corynebacterium alimapuense]|uniref:Alpha-amylase n=1 Tax=Corynebacterium alimapuense TaxID=1576874 RepID=A0A3M8K5Z0_9CORY|nr:alpha-amylase family glycosyl hydrolase [Corynebacterium alimapuense]RNE48520.1 alpha-amylase [Corynebacterium alimapuense]